MRPCRPRPRLAAPAAGIRGRDPHPTRPHSRAASESSRPPARRFCDGATPASSWPICALRHAQLLAQGVSIDVQPQLAQTLQVQLGLGGGAPPAATTIRATSAGCGDSSSATGLARRPRPRQLQPRWHHGRRRHHPGVAAAHAQPLQPGVQLIAGDGAGDHRQPAAPGRQLGRVAQPGLVQPLHQLLAGRTAVERRMNGPGQTDLLDPAQRAGHLPFAQHRQQLVADAGAGQVAHQPHLHALRASSRVSRPSQSGSGSRSGSPGRCGWDPR